MKTINFIELCELIKEGRAPSVITFGEKEFLWDGSRYIATALSSGIKEITDYSLPILLNNPIQIPLESLLTDKEREYLGNVTKPFKEDVQIIEKCRDRSKGMDFIGIGLSEDAVQLPNYPIGEYYRGLEYDTAYSPKELGLDQ